MAKLQRQEAILTMKSAASLTGVRFDSPTSATAPEVVLDIARWVEMGHPTQIKVTVEPVARDRV